MIQILFSCEPSCSLISYRGGLEQFCIKAVTVGCDRGELWHWKAVEAWLDILCPICLLPGITWVSAVSLILVCSAAQLVQQSPKHRHSQPPYISITDLPMLGQVVVQTQSKTVDQSHLAIVTRPSSLIGWGRPVPFLCELNLLGCPCGAGWVNKDSVFWD